jgi:hypothetical protein
MSDFISIPSAIGDFGIIKAILEIANTTPEGCFVEVGVYRGGVACHLSRMAEEQNREVFLYDTFEGIPFKDDIDSHFVGDFNDTDYETVKNSIPYANVIKGIFPDSIVEMPKIAFAHIDVDQYQSYIDCIKYLSPLMVSGGIMWFDDYPLVGAKKAIHECFKEEQLIFHPCGAEKLYVVF